VIIAKSIPTEHRFFFLTLNKQHVLKKSCLPFLSNITKALHKTVHFLYLCISEVACNCH